MLVDWISETVFPQMRIEDIAASHPGAIKIGPFGSQLKKEDLSEFGYKVYGQENIIANDFSLGKRRIDNSKFLSLKSCRLYPGDLVITMMGTIGKCTVFPDNAEVGIMDSHLLRIQVNTEIADKKFMALVIAAEEVVGRQISQMSHGSIMSGLSSSIVRRLRVPLPPLNEQQYIVEILDTIDEEIAHTSSIIAKLKQIKAGLLHDLLTRGLDDNGELRDAIAHPEQFKDSPLGSIPKDWQCVKLRDLCKTPIRDFGSFSMTNLITFLDSGIPFLKSEMIEEDYLNTKNLTFISKNVHELLKKSWVYPENILYSKIGSALGKAVLYKGDLGICNSNAAIAKIDINNTIALPEYIVYVLNSQQLKHRFMKKIISLLPRINLTDIYNFDIPLPPLSEQNQNIEVLNSHEQRIKTEEAYLEKLKLQKKGLMHDLLTGKVRVNQV
jgi:type I restriction enzyme S subunit